MPPNASLPTPDAVPEMPDDAAFDAGFDASFDASRDRARIDGGRVPWHAGCLGAVREALDDARAALVFVRTGLRVRAIDPGETLWIIDLTPGDGERAWRVLDALRTQAPRGPAIRYFASCLDPGHRAWLMRHPCLAALVAEGVLYLDAGSDSGVLPPHPLRNPPVILAHGGFASRQQSRHVFRRGELMTCVPDTGGIDIWRPADRDDGLLRLAQAYRTVLDGVPFTLPAGAMRLIATLVDHSGGRLLLRGSDHGACDLDRLLRGDAMPDAVNFDAMARWHRAHGASVHQSHRAANGRVLHLALHAQASPGLRDCLPDLLALPHPDDHVDVLQALEGIPSLSAAQYRALLRATGNDPRAREALSGRCTEHVEDTIADGWAGQVQPSPGQDGRCDPDAADGSPIERGGGG